MSKIALWLIFCGSAVSYQLFKHMMWGTADIEDAISSIYWTGFALLMWHFMGDH